MPKYCVVYQVFIPSHYRPPEYSGMDKSCMTCFGIVPDQHFSFACDLENLTESQLESLLLLVNQKYKIRICENWDADQKAHGVIFLIRDTDYKNLDAADRVELDRMKERYKQAKESFTFDATIIAPLAHCVNIADDIVRYDRETQDALEDTSELYRKELLDKSSTEKQITPKSANVGELSDASSKTVNKGGRPRTPRAKWIIEQYDKGLTPAKILDKWDGMSDDNRKSIDNKKYKRFVSARLTGKEKAAERKKARGSIEKLRPKQVDS